ncbi:hypothetical protein BGZ74_002384 [Mortierella antarctica]|nr:hypothetical protein BGZ74_002384 [Mortierella antarctica]
MAARVILNMWYRTKNPKGRPIKDSPQHKRHFAWIFAGVIISYLSYTVIQFERALGSNHYDMLDLQFSTFTQKQLKTNFRKASLQYHPDKIGEAGEDIFVKIRAAHQVLVDPILRVAYDRFGPGITGCLTCKTTKDYVKYGINDYRAFYSGSYLVLFLLGTVGKAGFGKYWRYVALTYMAAWEFSMIMGPKRASLVSYAFPHRTTYEQLRIARQIFVSVAVAINQIGPLVLPSTVEKKVDIKDVIKKISELNDQIVASSAEQLQQSFDVFRDDAECMIQLKRQMSGVIIDSLIAANQPVFDDARMAVYKRIKDPPKQGYYDEKKSQFENI